MRGFRFLVGLGHRSLQEGAVKCVTMERDMRGSMEGGGRRSAPKRKRPDDGGVFTVLFVVSGLTIAAIPVVMWLYFDHYEGTLKPHTVTQCLSNHHAASCSLVPAPLRRKNLFEE